MIEKKSITVLNTPCVLTDLQRLTDEISEWCLHSYNDKPLSVDFSNVHITALRTTSPDFYDITSSVDWFVSDSQILSWAISLAGGENHSRVYGPAFMDYFFRNGDTRLTHFLLGASEECLRDLRSNLIRIQPDAQIVGVHHGFFKEPDEEAIMDLINTCAPDILWVGLGTPKQQEWINRQKSLLNSKALLAVGFAFDVNAGTKSDAPAWLGPMGLTWLYRLFSEPRRLWKRYLIYNSIFVWRLTTQLITGKTTPPPTPNN